MERFKRTGRLNNFIPLWSGDQALSVWLRYALAVVAFVVALTIRLIILPVEDGLAFLTFYPATAVIALLCGIGPCLLMTGLGAVAGLYIFTPPYWSLKASSGGWLGVSVFVFSGILIGWLADQMQFMSRGRLWLAAIIQSSDDAIVSKTLDGIITSWNPAAERLFGYSAAEAVGQPMTMIFPPDRLEEERYLLDRVAHGENVYRYQTVRVHKNGSQIAVSVNLSAIRDWNGRIVGASKIAHDITDRRRLEEGLIKANRKLADSRDFTDAILNSLSPHIAIIDGSGTIIKVNEPWTRFGQDNGMPDGRGGVGDQYLAVCAAAAPTDSKAAAVAEGIQAVLARRERDFNLDYPCHAPDVQRWFHLRVKPLAGASGGAVVSHDDISAQKMAELALNDAKRLAEATSQVLAKSEQFTRAITDNLPGMVGYWTSDLRCRFANRHYYEWFGVGADQMLGIGMRDLLGEALFAENESYIRGALDGQEQTFERRLVKPGGEVGHTLARYIPDQDDQGRVRGFFVLVTDITGIKQTELRLNEVNDELRRLSRVDALTGAANRGWFDRQLEDEWRRAARTKTPVGLLLLDVDHFKLYNDHYGHPAGDSCLKDVVAVITGVVRQPPDMVARYGGEEFVCLLPGADLAGIHTVGERILDELRQRRLPHACSGVADHVTVSIGAASLVPEADQNPKVLVEATDCLLYRAKHQGRNRLVAACPPAGGAPACLEPDVRPCAERVVRDAVDEGHGD